MNQHKLLDMMFRPGELICVAEQLTDAKFVRWNGQQIGKSRVALNPFKEDTQRVADNVACYRNIMLEMDKLPLSEQAAKVKGKEMPFSASIFSGGKSIHWIISLDRDVTRERYKELSEMIYAGVEGENWLRYRAQCWNSKDLNVDASPFNIANGYTRMPDIPRLYNGEWKKQRVVEMRSPVSPDDIESWYLFYAPMWQKPVKKTYVKKPDAIGFHLYRPAKEVAGRRLTGGKDHFNNKCIELKCPVCGGGSHNEKSFTAYVDETGRIIPGAGICSRKNKCGEIISPTQADPSKRWTNIDLKKD